MKLNLGCGYNYRPDWINADIAPDCNPDVLMDMERFPWPFPDSSFHEVAINHALEHVGQLPETYLAVIRELYRVCAHQAKVIITVPHPRHEQYLIDPTHVRPIMPESFLMFSQEINRTIIADKGSDSPLGLRNGVDFVTEAIHYHLDPVWEDRRNRGEINDEQLQAALRSQNNVVDFYTVILKVVKPG
ncbi:MAG: class I SAM-dependent methyltransferase [Alphaproteobacteria bacterium]